MGGCFFRSPRNGMILVGRRRMIENVPGPFFARPTAPPSDLAVRTTSGCWLHLARSECLRADHWVQGEPQPRVRVLSLRTGGGFAPPGGCQHAHPWVAPPQLLLVLGSMVWACARDGVDPLFLCSVLCLGARLPARAFGEWVLMKLGACGPPLRPRIAPLVLCC